MIVKTDIEYTYSIMIDTLNLLVKKYPFLNYGSIGLSVMHKSIPYIRIGKGKNKVLYVASTHANEWITTPALLKFIEDYCIAYENNTNISNMRATTLFEQSSIYIVPMVNPDGVDLVNNAIDKVSPFYIGALQIANSYPSISFPSGWKANISGIDLNLQFPAGWENAKEIKYTQGFVSPAPRDFVGTFPLEAPEAIGLFDFAINLNPGLMMTYHAQGNVIYYKYLDYNPPKAQSIGIELSNLSGYALEETPTVSGYAGYKDWFIFEFNRPAYTIEVGSGKNPLPIEDFDGIYERNIDMLVYAATATLG